MYRSASGLACGLRGQLAAVDAGVHVALAAPDRDVVPAEHPADVRAEELVGAEQHRACPRGSSGPPRPRSTRCSRCRSPPSPRRWCSRTRPRRRRGSRAFQARSWSAVSESASEQPAFASGISTVLSGDRIFAVSAMKCTPQKTIVDSRRGGGDPGQRERVADVVGDVLDLRAPGSCAPGSRRRARRASSRTSLRPIGEPGPRRDQRVRHRCRLRGRGSRSSAASGRGFRLIIENMPNRIRSSWKCWRSSSRSAREVLAAVFTVRPDTPGRASCRSCCGSERGSPPPASGRSPAGGARRRGRRRLRGSAARARRWTSTGSRTSNRSVCSPIPIGCPATG